MGDLIHEFKVTRNEDDTYNLMHRYSDDDKGYTFRNLTREQYKQLIARLLTY